MPLKSMKLKFFVNLNPSYCYHFHLWEDIIIILPELIKNRNKKILLTLNFSFNLFFNNIF